MALPAVGTFRERIAFEARPDPTEDELGNEVTGDFAEQFRRFARIQPSKGFGNETVQAARLTGTQPMIIRVHSDSATRTVTSAWRIRDVRSDAVYNIRSFANMDELGKYIDFLCVSGEATG